MTEFGLEVPLKSTIRVTQSQQCTKGVLEKVNWQKMEWHLICLTHHVEKPHNVLFLLLERLSLLSDPWNQLEPKSLLFLEPGVSDYPSRPSGCQDINRGTFCCGPLTVQKDLRLRDSNNASQLLCATHQQTGTHWHYTSAMPVGLRTPIQIKQMHFKQITISRLHLLYKCVTFSMVNFCAQNT